MSPFKDGPTNLFLEFGKNQVSSKIFDIVDIEFVLGVSGVVVVKWWSLAVFQINTHINQSTIDERLGCG